MAKLPAAKRNKLPAKSFAGPGRSFPIHDLAHAKAALRMAPRSNKVSTQTIRRKVFAKYPQLKPSSKKGK